MTFKQKLNGLGSREYIIVQEGVKVVMRSIIGTSSIFYDFHHIGTSIVHQRKRKLLPILLGVFLLFFAIWQGVMTYKGIERGSSLAIGCTVLSLLIIAVFWLPGKKYLLLKNDQSNISIRFLYNIPSEEALLGFIDHIWKAQRIRFQRLYLNIDENISYEEYRKNIEWLRDSGFLPKEEAEQRLGGFKVDIN